MRSFFEFTHSQKLFFINKPNIEVLIMLQLFYFKAVCTIIWTSINAVTHEFNNYD